MDLHVLFIQHIEAYEGEIAPEAALVRDEFSVVDSPEAFEREVKQRVAEFGKIAAHAVIRIRVDQDAIRKILLDTPVVAGEIVP